MSLTAEAWVGGWQLHRAGLAADTEPLSVWVAPAGATPVPELERQLEQARQLAANLEAIADAWARYAVAQEQVLAHYRPGRRTTPSEELLLLVAAAAAELEALGQEVGA